MVLAITIRAVIALRGCTGRVVGRRRDTIAVNVNVSARARGGGRRRWCGRGCRFGSGRGVRAIGDDLCNWLRGNCLRNECATRFLTVHVSDVVSGRLHAIYAHLHYFGLPFGERGVVLCGSRKRNRRGLGNSFYLAGRTLNVLLLFGNNRRCV